MTVYLDAVDMSKNIDLLLDPEVLSITKEYEQARASNSDRKIWGIAAVTLLALFLLRRSRMVGTVTILCGGNALRHSSRYYKRKKLPGSDLNEVYQKIGSKIEDIVTSELPEEKHALLKKIEIIRHSILDIQLEKKGFKQVWTDFDDRLSKIQAQLRSEGIQLSNQDYVDIVYGYLKNMKNKELAVQLIAFANKEVEPNKMKSKVRQLFIDYHQFDKAEDPAWTYYILPHLKSKNINHDLQVNEEQIAQFLQDGIDGQLMIKIIFLCIQGLKSCSCKTAKVLTEYRKEKTESSLA